MSNSNQKRTAFFISDRTGITAEMLGHSVLTQFSSVNFEQIPVPFIDSKSKAEEALARINTAARHSGQRPIIFSTLVDPDIRAIISSSEGLFLDCFQTFIVPLEKELGVQAARLVGLSHGLSNPLEYHHRIESVNFSMSHDDGASTRDFSIADVILVGVSRCGKTPTCLYMALQFGIKAANYPLIPEDLERMDLPEILKSQKAKIYGLTIEPERLHQIRSERKPGSTYASISTCEKEVKQAERLMRAGRIPFINTTTKSIEEISTTILQEARLSRHIY